MPGKTGLQMDARYDDPALAGLPHLGSVAGASRHVLAAHYVRDCEHVVELGGHKLPLTGFLTHAPKSVVSVDPKTQPFEADELNGLPCRVRHIARKFQEVTFELDPYSYALVLLGCSLKAYGSDPAANGTLFDLVDKAKKIVIEYGLGNERAVAQIPDIVERGGLRKVCQIDMRLEDEHNPPGFWLGERRFMVFEPNSPAG